MPFFIKTSNSGWSSAKKVYVKTSTSNATWSTVKKIYIKFSNTVAPYWKLITGNAGPDSDFSPTISADSYVIGSSAPVLTGSNYHWTYDTSLTLTYNFQKGDSNATFIPIFTNNKAYTPGNPTRASQPNTINYTTIWPDDYVANPTYFTFSMHAQDAKGVTTLQSDPISVSVPGPTWYQTASYSGTFSPGYTVTWDTGQARIMGSSTYVGYMTTIYKTNDGGITKTYVVGTATTPSFAYQDNYQYSIPLVSGDNNYTYYFNTYAIWADANGPKLNATPSINISRSKFVIGPPGAFSVTSFTKNAINGNLVGGSRSLYITYGAASNADFYEYKIERSIDNVTWYSWNDYFYQIAAANPTTAISITDSNIQSYRYYRVTMRATNSSGLYTYSSNTLDASGTAPGAPTINSIIVVDGVANVNYTESTNFGSGSGIYDHDYAYKLSSSNTWSSWISTGGSYGGTLYIYGLTAGNTYDIKIRSYNDDKIVSAESNVKQAHIPLIPDPITNANIKSFQSGSLTFSFTTGANTDSIYFFAYNGPYTGGQGSQYNVLSHFLGLSANTSYSFTVSDFVSYPNEQWDVLIYAQNSEYNGVPYTSDTNVGPSVQIATGIYTMGQDLPLVSVAPKFTYITSSGFTGAYTTYLATNTIIDLKTNGSSLPGYPTTISQSSISGGTAFTYIPGAALIDGNTYTLYVTPKYQSGAMSYTGSTSSVSQQILGNPGSFSMSTMLKGPTIIGTPGYRKIDLSWTASNDAYRYEVFVEGSPDGTSWTSALSYVSSPYIYAPTTNYSFNAAVYKYYRATVRASNLVQTSNTLNNNPIYYSYSNSNVAQLVPGTPPGAPTIGTITPAQTTASVPYTATTAYGSGSYSGVQWSLDNSSWSAVTTSNPLSLTGLTGGTTYTVYVRSVNSDGEVSYSVSKSFTTFSVGSILSYTIKHMEDAYFRIFYTTTGNVDTVNSYANRYYGSPVNGIQTSNSVDWTPNPLGTLSPAVAGRGYVTIYVGSFSDYASASYLWTSYLTPKYSGIIGTAASAYDGVIASTATDMPTATLGTVSTGDTILSTTVTLGGSATHYTLDVLDSVGSISGYPKLHQTGNISLTGLTNGTNYTIRVTPYYYYYYDSTETNADAKTSIKFPGSVVSKTGTPVKPSHTVTFNGNGNTGGSTAAQTTNTTTALTSNGFTRTNYTFASWNTAANGTGTSYSNGANYDFNADITLYAQWTYVPPAPTIITNPTLSGSGVAGTSLTASSGSYNNATIVATGIAYNTANGYTANSITTTSPGLTHTSPYAVTTSDATSPAYYFWAYNQILGSNGTTYYVYSSPTLSSLPTPVISKIVMTNGGSSAPFMSFAITATNAASFTFTINRGTTSPPTTAASGTSNSTTISTGSGGLNYYYEIYITPWSGANGTGISGTQKYAGIKRNTSTVTATTYNV